ncbi:rod-binding protein [Treponema sp. OttesenSCG-928-L16]|nr:rod-binding protein [Treponema sp. OttesenSCG-928-L16]
MDVGSLGSYYLNDTRLMTDSLGIARESSREAVETSFSDILGKTMAAEQGGTKAVIDKTDKLYEQCEALETFLVKTLLNSMRNTVQKSNLIDTGFAGKMYEDMLYDEYAKDFSKSAGFGLADMAYLELTGQRGKIINRSS